MRSRGRTVVAALTALVALVGLSSCAQDATAPAPPTPLRILLVNDDGWNAPGVVGLRDALRGAGHTVVQVSPTADRGDSGTAATYAGQLQVRRPTPDPDVYSVSGTASDAALFGLQAVMGSAWPDLVVSGVNPGRSVGLDTMRSGTVGAAMTAAALGFPAVAVSADNAEPRRPRPGDLARAADFTVRLVDALGRTRTDDASITPRRTVLNVNYPRGPETPRDVVVAPTADTSATSLYYGPGRGPDMYRAEPTTVPAPGGDNDASSLSSGNVVLTDLSADPDRSAPPPRLAARVASVLRP